MSTFAYLAPLAEAATRIGEGFDEITPTVGDVLGPFGDGEFLTDIADDLDETTYDNVEAAAAGVALNRYGRRLLDDLRLKWLGLASLRTDRDAMLDSMWPTFRSVADDVFELVFEDAERSDDDAIRRAYAERPITLSNVWSHPRTMFLDNAALGFWLQLLSWAADKDTDTVSDDTVRHLGTERLQVLDMHMGDLVTAGLITRQSSGWRLHVRFDNQT